MSNLHFSTRSEAGSKLAERMVYYAGRPDTLVLCISKSGVEVAKSVADHLHLPCYWFPVKSVFQSNLELAAVVDGMVVVHEELVCGFGITAAQLESKIEAVKQDIESMTEHILAESQLARISHQDLENKTLILVSDAIVIARRMRAAVVALRRHVPSTKLVLASPVIEGETEHLLQRDVMEVCSFSSPRMSAINSVY